MRRPILTFSALVATTLPSLAALPPQYQRQAEFAAVLEAATNAFGIERLIDAIEVSQPDVFTVRSGDCTLTVRIVDNKSKSSPGWAGPRQFTAVPDPLAC